MVDKQGCAGQCWIGRGRRLSDFGRECAGQPRLIGPLADPPATPQQLVADLLAAAARGNLAAAAPDLAGSPTTATLYDTPALPDVWNEVTRVNKAAYWVGEPVTCDPLEPAYSGGPAEIVSGFSHQKRPPGRKTPSPASRSFLQAVQLRALGGGWAAGGVAAESLPCWGRRGTPMIRGRHGGRAVPHLRSPSSTRANTEPLTDA